jgi:16S rRNA processing protein RimM
MEKKFLLIGKVVGTHGLNGCLKVRFWGEKERKDWKKVFIYNGSKYETFEVEDFKFHNKGFVLLKVSSVSTRDQAMQLKGSDVFIDKKELTELSDEEYYWFDLEDLEVYSKDGDFIGIIKEIFSTGSNDVFVVRNGTKENLIPGIKDVVLSIDKESGKMVINPIEGLL